MGKKNVKKTVEGVNKPLTNEMSTKNDLFSLHNSIQSFEMDCFAILYDLRLFFSRFYVKKRTEQGNHLIFFQNSLNHGIKFSMKEYRNCLKLFVPLFLVEKSLHTPYFYGNLFLFSSNFFQKKSSPPCRWSRGRGTPYILTRPSYVFISSTCLDV